MIKPISRALVLIGLSGLLLACGTIAERRMEYKKAESLPTLEMPPDLITVDVTDSLASATAPMAGSATMSEYSRGKDAAPTTGTGATVSKETVGPKDSDIVQLKHDGATRWLDVKMEPATLWAKLQGFLKDQGLPVKRVDQRVGIIETDWAENRGGVPLSSLWDKAFAALRSASTRDQYVVRVEPGAVAGTSSVFITHRGMAQVAQNDSTVWLPRAPEAWLEAELMGRLALALGAQDGLAQQIAGDGATPQQLGEIKHGDNDRVWLDVALDFPRAWARVASAVARTNIVIEDFDRAKGLFYVAGVLPQEEPKDKGWWARFTRGYVEEDPKEFKIKLEGTDAPTRASVLTKDGTPDNSKRAELLLEKIKEQLQ